jgi:hypothetical protein
VNDRQIFEVSIEIPGAKPAFLKLCDSLGVVVKHIEPGDNVAHAGTSYKPEVWKTLKFPIPRFPDLAQPCDQIVAGVPVYVWIREHHLEIIVAPAVGSTFLDEGDYLSAKAVDDLLSRTDIAGSGT